MQDRNTPLDGSNLDVADAAPPQRTCLLVLGMHRSGTSALTRVLSLMGASLPKHILGAGKSNETGHWEPQKLVDPHDRLLAEVGSAWHDCQALNLTQVPFQRRQALAAETIELLRSEYADAPLILVEDPRVCRFASLFFDTLASVGVETCAVLPIRNPLEVAASLVQRDGMLQADAALLWLRHVLDAEAATRALPRAILSYSVLLADWKKSIRRLTERLEIKWPYTIEDIDEQVARFLAPLQRHHPRSDADILQDPVMRGLVADAYHALQVLEVNPASKTALADLDRIRGKFDRATPIIHYHSGQTHGREKALADKLAMYEAIIAEREAALAEAHAKAETLATQLGFAQHMCQAYKSSTSWRLTAPIRATKRAIKAGVKPLRSLGKLVRGAMIIPKRTHLFSRAKRVIEGSGLFDQQYYLEAYPDVRASGMNPIVHYVRFGAAEGRNPSEAFNTSFYLSSFPDVASANINPLYHYIVFGQHENKLIAPPSPVHLVGVPNTSASGPQRPLVQAAKKETSILRRPYSFTPSVAEHDGRPRILVLPAIFAVGGVERNTAAIMRELTTYFKFVVVTNEFHTKETGCLLDTIKDTCEAIFDLAAQSDKAAHIRHLQTIVESYPPDLVWICNGSTWYHENLDELHEIFHGAPIVDQQIYDTKAGWINWMTPEYSQRISRYVAINSKIAEKLAAEFSPPEKIDLIYPAVDLARLKVSRTVEVTYKGQEQEKESRHFVFVGRLSDQKRPLDLIQAACLLQEKASGITLEIVGSGPLEIKCAERIKKYRLHNIRMTPFVEDVAEVYARADGIVFVSEYEGLPIVMLEALASGVPVISTDVGDIRKVAAELGGGCAIMDGAIGHPSIIADALVSFSSEIQRHQQAAAEVSQIVIDRFSASNIARQYLGCFSAAFQIQAAKDMER